MASRKPNILLLFTDQQRADTIHAAGNPVIRTPALDRLCAEGMRFDSAFTPSPVCVPARCSMIYGQYPPRTGCYANRFPMPEDGRASFMQALTEAGYRTHALGKMHFRPDPHALRGLQTRERQEELLKEGPAEDEYLKFLHDNGFAHVCDPHGIRGEMYYIPQPAQMPAHLHPTHWVGDRSVAFLEQETSGDEPWFLFASFVHPHPPFAPPNPWHKLYRAPLMPLPKVPPGAEAFHTYINRRQNRYKYRDQGIDLNLVRGLKAYYYACISFIDFQIGRILKALDQTGQLDNTLIMFTSDHGEFLGDYNCFGKRSMLDSAARVPMIVRFPERFPAGEVCRRPVSLVDVAPTFLAASAAETTDHALDGFDLAEVAAGRCDRQEVFSQFETGPAAVTMAVNDTCKYFHSAPDNRAFLFDRVQDPNELRNRHGLVFVREQQDQMKWRLFEFLRTVGETEGLDGDDWKVMPKMEIPRNPDAGLLVQDHAWADSCISGYSWQSVQAFDAENPEALPGNESASSHS